MATPYLDVADYETFGIDSTDPEQEYLAIQATILINGYLGRELASKQYNDTLISSGRSQFFVLPETPVISVDTLEARCAYGRGGVRQDVRFPLDRTGALKLQMFLEDPATWDTIDVDQVEITQGESGRILVPANLFGRPYNEIKITWTAGYTTTPEPIQLVCAQLMKSLPVAPAGNLQSVREGDIWAAWYDSSYLRDDMKKILDSYKRRTLR